MPFYGKSGVKGFVSATSVGSWTRSWILYSIIGMSFIFLAVRSALRRWVQPKPPKSSAVAKKALGELKSAQRVRQGTEHSETMRLENNEKTTSIKQPFEAFLVVDVEGTCEEGSSFDYPNEIIEIPVALMTWKSRLSSGEDRELVVKAEFHTFVKPSWKPVLSPFCMELTGIQQQEIDNAPDFVQALQDLEQFLANQGLINSETGERKMNFCWCSDGPFDIRDFMVKQAFISQVPLPNWLKGELLDVRAMVSHWCQYGTTKQTKRTKKHAAVSRNIVAQLRALELPPFEGRQHSGRDDTRNVCRILAELARRGMRLQPNTTINFRRRWPWMGRDGRVLYGSS